ncbi:MAG: hydantoinase/oxoprolinase family protein [Rhodobacteraceae bacterium]|nr:hydantoinase/oxoprolinase family protein [Paracoccaceae bacterium]
MPSSLVRLGVDIGGTFTDVVLDTPSGALTSVKVLTTPRAPENAIVEGIHQVCAKASITPADIDQIIHGTTLATNALIERRGAKTALITTQGFRDVIEMRTESRFEQYDLNLNLPQPLLPRQLRFTLRERVTAQGEVMIPLAPTELEALIARIAGAGIESVAVGLIHSYLAPAHEQRVREALGRALPHVAVSLSCEVSPQMREYERFNTVVANAYIKPLMASYLGRLRGRLQAEGIGGAVFLMHSGGGIITLENAAAFPVRLLESGPAGGAVFAAHIAARHNLAKVLSFDMGGTTAKICLVKEQTPKTARVFEVARSYRFKKGSGMPISIPVIDMVEIGAGGGSLAHVDALRQIRVGPESAGAEPGPACYGQGGERPSITDADLVLGKMDSENFAGGTLKLRSDRAETALKTYVGDPLGMSPLEAALGVAEVVDETMANAARVHAVENGEDLSQYSMIAFGGAAPLHAARLCAKLGIRRLLVPPGAGVGSAIGFLRAPFSFEASRSVYMRLGDFDPPRIKSLLAELDEEATGFVRACNVGRPLTSTYKAYMRYRGQGWEIAIVLSHAQITNPSAASFLARFEQEYTKLFGRPVAGLDVEIIAWSVNASTRPERVDPVREGGRLLPAHSTGTRQIFDAGSETYLTAQLIERAELEGGQWVRGPAAITETETTIVVPPGYTATCLADGCIAMAPQHQESPT